MPDGGTPQLLTRITPATWDETGWNRAWQRGYDEGLREALVAVVFIADADHALSKVEPAMRRAIWKQALYDVHCEHGSLPKVIRRAMAARRIVLVARDSRA